MEMPWHTLGSSAVSQPRGILGMHCHYMTPPQKGEFKMMKHEELLSSCDVLKGGGKTKKTKPWTVLSNSINGWGVVSCRLVIWLVNSTFFNPMFGLRKSVRICEIFWDSSRNIYLGVPVFSRFCSPKQVSKNTREPTQKFFCAPTKNQRWSSSQYSCGHQKAFSFRLGNPYKVAPRILLKRHPKIDVWKVDYIVYIYILRIYIYINIRTYLGNPTSILMMILS